MCRFLDTGFIDELIAFLTAGLASSTEASTSIEPAPRTLEDLQATANQLIARLMPDTAAVAATDLAGAVAVEQLLTAMDNVVIRAEEELAAALAARERLRRQF